MQTTLDQQVSLSYLLGLDWTLPVEWQSVRERERGLQELKKAATQGSLGVKIGDLGELRASLAIAEAAVTRLRRQLEAFTVIEEYNELQRELNRISQDLSRALDEIVLTEKYLLTLAEESAQESPPDLDALALLYRQVGVELPQAALAKYSDVLAFHESVVRNRSSYLREEQLANEDRLRELRDLVERLDARRGQIMQTLKAGGALDTFVGLQQELGRREAEVEALRQRYQAAEAFETDRTGFRLERQSLAERLQRDHLSNVDILNEVAVVFGDMTKELYRDREGKLSITATENGPRFAASIDGDRSSGITNVLIYCFDLTLMALALPSGRCPDFIVHDSHIFDGVDVRQIDNALRLAVRECERLEAQHVITMNSDALPQFQGSLDVSPYVLPVVLTDRYEDGGLFGVRFG